MSAIGSKNSKSTSTSSWGGSVRTGKQQDRSPYPLAVLFFLLFSFRHRLPVQVPDHLQAEQLQITEPGSTAYLNTSGTPCSPYPPCLPSTPMFLCVRSLPICVRSLSPPSACRKAVSRQYHHLHHSQPRRLPRFGARLVLVAGVATTTAFAASPLWPNDVYADTNDDANGEDANIRSAPLTSLLRSYFVFSVCSVPVFVDWSPHIISFMTSVPGLKQLAGALVRRSFFAQVRIFSLDHHF